ncbi:hypothetical protein POM88_035654 [Heracleum sosnowskyi]|uniref:Uncharacterized protein n=1 Tax=Heracleum sosnowskyi TaxID=360622 RepID=A0AAD8HLP7_9APIA|nr:hypothetical protein POM88_035654 [Heracleum sosnowskyi]
MSLFIDLVETFEMCGLTGKMYTEKIDYLLMRFPQYDGNVHYKIALPHKYPKTADDYLSMKFCAIGRLPVYGIFNKRDLQLIAVCVQGTLFAIDDCDLDPNLVPDLHFHKLDLGIPHSSLAVSQTLSCTKTSICSAISTLSLGYTPQKKDEWTDAFVLLTEITTHAVRFSCIKYHVNCGLYTKGDAQNLPGMTSLRLPRLWNQLSNAIRTNTYPFNYKYSAAEDGLYFRGVVNKFNAQCVVSLINNSDKTDGRIYGEANQQMQGKRNLKSKNSIVQLAAALGASHKVFASTRASMRDSCFDQFGISNGIRDFKMVKGTQESRQSMQLGRGTTLEALGATCIHPLQVIMSRLEDEHCNAKSAYSCMLDVFRKTFRHEPLKGFHKGLSLKLLKVVCSISNKT